MLIKKDHCTPIFFFLPIVSETNNESTYQEININIIMYSFMLLFLRVINQGFLFLALVKIYKQVNSWY
jgi:hypothetical protein